MRGSTKANGEQGILPSRRKKSRLVFYLVHNELLDLLSNLGQNLLVSVENVLVLANLDGGSTKVGEKHDVTGSDGREDLVAIRVGETGADSNDTSLVELLDVLLGDEET